ncbi:PREDICTED: zinc finger protein 26 [Rhagoletis zephyria]|uniref:zinc finger protein 26 n=1 Tax=Rhagoletis zephyria TaxID=28612 RepID=UPI00081151B0|nr:PREDICTED: zinc finger protein 26 [Rhagoletis zephyria]
MSFANSSTNYCPRCGILVTENANRLVTDSCGHRKCRQCLLADDECMECQLQQRNDLNNITSHSIDADIVTEAEAAPVEKNDIVVKTSKKKGRKTVALPAHIRQEENDSNSGVHYHCTKCDRKFTSRSQQYYHLTCGSNASKKYKCLQCDKAFATSSHFNYHMETHAEHTYFCKECNKSFTNRMVLRKHEKLHYTAPLKCSECNKEFRSKESLTAHIRKLHDDKDLPYKCKECQKSYALKATLKQHIQKHFDKRFKCQYCDKRFQRNYTLKLHLKKHTKTDCFICGICMHKFSDSAVLLRHVKLHQDTIKYHCTDCDVTIMRKDNMLRHIRTIHPEKSFENCVKITLPTHNSSNSHEKIEAGDLSTNMTAVVEPQTVENSAVIKCIGNVAPMKVPTCQISLDNIQELNIDPTEVDVNTKAITNDSTLTTLQNVTLNAGTDTNGSSKKMKVKKKYDPIKMYRKILASDCEDESESEREETYVKQKTADNLVASVDMAPSLERRVALSTSNFSEMHWRKNFKYTYEYQDF